MAPKQRMRLASQKHSQNVTQRGNVPKSMVRIWSTDILNYSIYIQ